MSKPGSGEIRLLGVAKTFAGAMAVDHISLDIAAGEFFSLLGSSGCGKTTTLKMLGGFLRPDAGEIRIDGIDVSDQPAYRRPTNTVFQSYALFPHLTVGENVAFGLRYAGVPRADWARRVTDALSLVRLKSAADRDVRNLSGGQQQRVALARALVLRPAALLLDEPLGALDAQLRRRLQVELKTLQQSLGTTFVYVTHDQEEALTMSDRLAVMRDGRVEQVGTPQEVYERPASAFVADFLGASNILDVAIQKGPRHELTVSAGGRLVFAGPGMAGAPAGRISVRPECVTLSGCEDTTAMLTGVVENVQFTGPTTSVRVRLPDDQVLTAHDSPGNGWKVGDRTAVAIKPGSAHRLNA